MSRVEVSVCCVRVCLYVYDDPPSTHPTRLRDDHEIDESQQFFLQREYFLEAARRVSSIADC